MRAFYFDNIPGDQRLLHDSGIPNQVDTVAKERSYRNSDIMTITKDGLGDLYEAKLKSFYEEHMHEDDEIRYILEGSGFWDIREHPSDSWIRCQIDAGDLLVIPAGIYHRFTLDENDMIKALRLSKDESKWTPFKRDSSTDVHPSRVDYLKGIAVN
ncbi:1,2-dihydroxy-3-keto-5-methylthiopentene dioxygenase [Suillus placidus]|uniref:Acireductone dioxygenase n=1 Tax=Suillus placidus TaxID=48579 RepID=A0A9P6ZMA9_9AGAM|nr:1,2-dihydroxy-3-keto-5-methylthiopentene dioxygenase [Suillus placidus]